MSRTDFPKQFLDILNTGKTLIQFTFERYASFLPKENIYIITVNEYIDIVQEQLPEVPPSNILAEPSRKNTAPCIAYIAFKFTNVASFIILLFCNIVDVFVNITFVSFVA